MPPNLTYAVLSQTFLHFTKAEAHGLSQTKFYFQFSTFYQQTQKALPCTGLSVLQFLLQMSILDVTI